MKSEGPVTLTSYQAATKLYVEQTPPLGEHLTAFLDQVAIAVGSGGFLLELGSGPGRAAMYLEDKYLRVRRTDAAPIFIDMMRADGHHADVLDIRTDAFGGPYDAILATSVLLHLSRDEFENVLQRANAAVAPDGVLAFTIKKGLGSGPGTTKSGSSQQFTCWREPELRDVLARTGWVPALLEHVDADEPWMCVIARSQSSF